jgi:hypothetical protein
MRRFLDLHQEPREQFRQQVAKHNPKHDEGSQETPVVDNVLFRQSVVCGDEIPPPFQRIHAAKIIIFVRRSKSVRPPSGEVPSALWRKCYVLFFAQLLTRRKFYAIFAAHFKECRVTNLLSN